MEMSKPRPILSDMPLHIKQNIADHTDPFSKCALRRCSRDLRLAVDRSKSSYWLIKLEVTSTEVRLQIENNSNQIKSIKYKKKGSNNCLLNGKIVEGMNYIHKAAADLALILKNPETEIRAFLVESPMDLEVLQHAFGNFNHKLNVKTSVLSALCGATIPRVLSFFKPGTLQTLGFHLCDLRDNTTGLFESEHWKQAVSLDIYPSTPLPLVSLLHFRSVSIGNFDLKPEDVEIMINAFLDRGEEFESWTLINWTQHDRYGVFDYLNHYPRLKPNDRSRWHIKIPATPYHLEVSCQSMRWSFVKILSSELNKVDVQ